MMPAMSKLRSGVLLTLFLAGATFGFACAEDEGYTCTVTWLVEEGGMELGTANFTFGYAGSANEAVEMCETDQEDHEDRPAEANYYYCSCESR
jgi:hypothetical protein